MLYMWIKCGFFGENLWWCGTPNDDFRSIGALTYVMFVVLRIVWNPQYCNKTYSSYIEQLIICLNAEVFHIDMCI